MTVLSCLHGNPSSEGTLTGLFLEIAFLSNFPGLKSRAWLLILKSMEDVSTRENKGVMSEDFTYKGTCLGEESIFDPPSRLGTARVNLSEF